MITEKDIKPIPKYIVKRIKQLDKKQNPNYSSVRRFYSYLTKFNGELAKVTVAVKEHYKDWYIKQVAVHGIHNDKCFVKDMEFYLTVGYVVGWYEQGLQKHRKIYEYEDWCWADDKYYDPIAPVVNPEFALTFKQYKYSQADKYKQHNIFKYLRTYEKYPATEYLVKLNLSHYATSVMLLKKLTKDKKFRKWVINNAEDFAHHCYDIQAILYAYNHNKTMNVASSIFAYKRSIKNNTRFQEIEKLFDGNIEQFFHYIEKQNTNIASYLDYKDACEYLGLDMNEDKNRYPHNFKYWHDVRIDQYHTAKALKDKSIYELISCADKYTADEDKVTILYFLDIKWYREFKDASWIENFIQKVDSVFVRTGEDINDNEEMCFNEGCELFEYCRLTRIVDISGNKQVKKDYNLNKL